MEALESSRPNIDVFAETLASLAAQDRDILVVTGDSRGSGKLTSFGQQFPDRIVEIGIAEQNLVGISAGLAAAGKKVFAVSPACFLTARALEQIKNDVAYSDHPVKLIGISAGVSYGALGTTHHSLHDLAVLKAINNIDIVVPADNFETREVIRASLQYTRPIYIRFGKRPVPNLHRPEEIFIIGQSIQLRAGTDITFIATGETVSRAVLACDLLAEDGISAGVISMHTIRPFDVQALLRAAQTSQSIVTVEEHSIEGGLGSLCAATLMESGHWIPFRRVAIPDEHTVTGSQEEIFQHYGITAEGLSKTARELLAERSASNLPPDRPRAQAAAVKTGSNRLGPDMNSSQAR
jgi:transketolase